MIDDILKFNHSKTIWRDQLSHGEGGLWDILGTRWDDSFRRLL